MDAARGNFHHVVPFRTLRARRAGLARKHGRLPRTGPLLCGLVALAGVCCARAPAQAAPADSMAVALRHEVARVDLTRRAGRAGPADPTRAELLALYAKLQWRPAWTEAGRPTRQADTVIALLAASASHGLRSEDYAPDSLRALAAALAPATAAAVARFDVALSAAAMRALTDLHGGRVAPRSLGVDLPAHRLASLDSLVIALSNTRDVTAVVRAVEPRYAEYHALLGALRHYRALAADTAWRAPRFPRDVIRWGEQWRDAPVLRRLLDDYGDLPPAFAASDVDPDSTIYDSTLVRGIMSFQVRHDLTPDGVIGPATIRALRVTPARRARQIVLALERWRWMPDSLPSRYVLVNAPAFRLYAFADDPAVSEPVLQMKVIVGRAEVRHITPVFDSNIRQVVFRPYWDVPRSIARRELVPRFRREPGAFAAEGFEIVSGTDQDTVGHPFTLGNLDLVAAGTLRLRQRPGPLNPLGDVKFIFPNGYHVFLHGTPATELFERTRRDLSHGCIRVEHPAALAAFVLDDSTRWTPAAIDSAMHGDGTLAVPLPRPVGVYILYVTTMVDAEGRVTFYPDLYGRDTALARALRAPSRHAPPAAAPSSGRHSPDASGGFGLLTVARPWRMFERRTRTEDAMKARDIMTANPRVVTPTESVTHAAKIMRDLDVGIVPVVDDIGTMHLEGVLTDRDIAVRCVAHGHHGNCRVSDHMTADHLDVVRADADVNEVIRKMEEGLVRRIPVVADGSRLVGIIAQADLAVKLGPKAPQVIEELIEKISTPLVALH